VMEFIVLFSAAENRNAGIERSRPQRLSAPGASSFKGEFDQSRCPAPRARERMLEAACLTERL
jgi:hypothetical protein